MPSSLEAEGSRVYPKAGFFFKSGCRMDYASIRRSCFFAVFDRNQEESLFGPKYFNAACMCWRLVRAVLRVLVKMIAAD